MLHTTDPDARAEFIASLRALADFLANNPAVPVPKYSPEITLCADSYEDGGQAQVDHTARLLRAPVINEVPFGGHYHTAREFGCLAYRMISIPALDMAKHRAQMSYAGCVTPDTNWE